MIQAQEANVESKPVVVIGATGNVGRHAVAALSRAGRRVRAVARNPCSRTFPPDVKAVAADVSNADEFAEAVEGAGSAFLVFPTLRADDHAAAVVRTLADRVERIVYLSSVGVSPARTDEPGIIGSHSRVEQLIRESGAEWTFLRSGGMATNTLAWDDQVRSDATVRWPFAAAARSLVHEADLGDVAAYVLTTPGHHDATYELTGPEVLTHAEQAQAIGGAIGSEVQFIEVPRPRMREQMVDEWGLEESVADEMLDAWAAMVGNTDGVTDTIERLLGRPARPFAQWARDHEADFRRTSAEQPGEAARVP